MFKCIACGSKFQDFMQQIVVWSADTIPMCPICGINVHQGEFDYIEDNKIKTK